MDQAEIVFRSHPIVVLEDVMASDLRVVKIARVSTLGADTEAKRLGENGLPKFIDFLMRSRHGSPFEHNVFTFLISTPLFVAREFMRHRLFSYNEESSRYKQLEPVFYVPSDDRPLQQTGKPGDYHMVPGERWQKELVTAELREHATRAYRSYERQLEQGVAREVARMVLPVNIFTSFYATVNARSLMNFLSLRVEDLEAMFPSHALHEIQQVAQLMEMHFAEVMPQTQAAFERRGRVAPLSKKCSKMAV